jgi:hypothetical protein
VLRLCGCEITSEDSDTLIALLDADVTLLSDEAAAALRWAQDTGSPINQLDDDICLALQHVLSEVPAGSLTTLRSVLGRGCC